MTTNRPSRDISYAARFRIRSPRATLWPAVAAIAAAACSEDQWNIPPEKYHVLPDDGPAELNLPEDAELLDEVMVSVELGGWQRFRFRQVQGTRYIIGLTELTADLDLFTRWDRDITRDQYQFVSWNWALEDEQIEIESSDSDDYFIAVNGYEAGQAKLQLYSYVLPESPADEVVWPVSWGNDSATEDALVNGGLGWLEPWSYGGTCGPETTPHPGLDLNYPNDYKMPVVAAADGEVIFSEYRGNSSWGNLVVIKHRLTSTGLQFYSAYGHLFQRDVEVGDIVTRGVTQVGLIGTGGTGANEVSPHLHFEIRTDLSLTASQFPCKWAAHSVDASYEDPRVFVASH